MAKKKEKSRIEELNDLITEIFKFCDNWINDEDDENSYTSEQLFQITGMLEDAMTQIELIAECGSEPDIELLKDKTKKHSW